MEKEQYHTFSEASSNADKHETELSNIGCFRHLRLAILQQVWNSVEQAIAHAIEKLDFVDVC